MGFNYPRKPNEEQFILAHGLNNDLTAILGRCELMGDVLSTNAEAREHLRIIRVAVHRMIDRVVGPPSSTRKGPHETACATLPRRSVIWGDVEVKSLRKIEHDPFE
jgi:hypothetical protein